MVCLVCLFVVPAKAMEKIVIQSPNSKIVLSVTLDQRVHYSITHEEQLIVDESMIGLQLSGGNLLGVLPELISKKEKVVDEVVNSPFYRSSEIKNRYRELDLKLKGSYGILFRVYDQGVAYRFYTTINDEIEIKNEIAEFRFDDDYMAYLAHTTNPEKPFSMAFQNIYKKELLSRADTSLVFLPLTVDLRNGKKLTITESDLESYPGMFIRVGQSEKMLKAVFSPFPAGFDYHPWRHQEYVTERADFIAKTKGSRIFPWRILAISENDVEMPVNDLVYLLASPNRIGDYSWVKPGKVAWEWWNNWGIYGVDFKAGINMETYRYYIDFASRYGLEYVVLDEGWYDPKSGDMMTVVPQLDLPELVAYAESKGVGIVLWTVFNVLDSQLEKACTHYAKMGVKGFKIDFLDRDDQSAVEMTYRIAEATAKHRLFIDLHGFYKPTGLNRTYPHIINFEGVFGMEEAKWSTIEKDMPQYDVTFPFIRMMAGPVDFTPGAMRNATKSDFQPIYNNPVSQGTRCHQLAMYIVYDSPFTMLCDAPTLYEKEPLFTAFLASLPVVVDETKIVAGELGEYIVTARRKGDLWYVGGLTNWTERTINIDFSFLEKQAEYRATIFKDGVNANRQGSDYQVNTIPIDAASELNIHMASGGGFVIKLEKIDQVSSPPSSLKLGPFYKKYIDAGGIPVVSSENVVDKVLIHAQSVVESMLSKRPDVKRVMVEKGCKVMIIGRDEEVCDLPEYAHICDTPGHIAYWNRRARGFGGAPEDALSASCGEENMLCLETDRYKGENILVHEFAHLIHTVGIVGLDPGFDSELETLRQHAIEKRRWENTYAITNKEEYFAESVQSFFNCNRYSEKPNGVHNAINTREKLKAYDPEMYELLFRYFPELDLDICNGDFFCINNSL